MFYTIYSLEYFSLLVLAGLWFLTAFMTRLLVFNSKNIARFRLWHMLTSITLIGGIIGFIIWIVLIGLLGIMFGWMFISDRVMIYLPPMLFSVIIIFFRVIPQLKKWSTYKKADKKLVIDQQLYEQLLSLKFILPVYAATVSFLLLFYTVWFNPIILPNIIDSVKYFLVWLVLNFIIYLYLNISLKAIRKRKNTSPKLWIELGKAIVVLGIVFVIAIANFIYGLEKSKWPEKISMINHKNVNYGGGIHNQHAYSHTNHKVSNQKSVSVLDLTGEVKNKIPDRSYTLTAEKTTTSLSSGKKVEKWTYTGGSEGAHLRAKQGEIIEVNLVNKNIDIGVTIHWHGYNVPNAMDGVAGMTQDTVMPGETFTYKFRAEQSGSYWFHSHQQSSKQVKKGLFGTLVVTPKKETFPYDEEIVVPIHTWNTKAGPITAFGLNDTLQKKKIEKGKKVRVRLINTDSSTHIFRVIRVPFKVIAIDGVNLNRPTLLKDQKLSIAAGGRYDVTFTMPDTPVEIKEESQPTRILLTNSGKGKPTNHNDNVAIFDPASYGTPTKTPLNTSSKFDRKFLMFLDNEMGFYNGTLTSLWTINGEIFPNTPTLMVQKGDFVKTTFINRSFATHPMHLHGHHVLVLSKNGKSITNSPWWTDSLDVFPGESYEVAFIADNPGIWMDHCHNLDHAATGMTLHLMYKGVTTPFSIGRKTGNFPE
ncbi:Multicopper oxidase with three cupredoxin domains (includes cell division protein FtsP and spore coat protein CotA) [Seinonella peptonophila]|uniref:Multicopper oxidase with three cupredoxin domains (Includes cell division protein FtsP and spore coat protein CotA) n=1 Tax=Seinonella peptonophila TaxID=112248 RepID=A0A1M5A554_9BACL|nr:multicopper oxidase family protein [Seinonella peptonophila]SHF25096.1 Multicopper oxidase with three cupredoxin domains (includes cell division protein FtsP and spore coat protein CotA) [Seinonella peptonophila]